MLATPYIASKGTRLARKNAVATGRFTVSVDPATDSVLQSMVPLGLHGKNKAEVASWVLREWIWHNRQELAAVGVKVRPPRSEVFDSPLPATPNRSSPGQARILTGIPVQE